MPEPVAVRLAAPPPQHLTAPGAVHAPLLVTARPDAAFGVVANALRPIRRAPATTPLTLSAAKPLTVPRRATPTRRPAAPAAKPPVTAPAATPVQEPVRVLAAVPLTPAAPAVSKPSSSNSSAAKPGNGKGHAYGHLKHASDPAPQPPATPEPLTPVVQPAPVVELTPVDQSSVDNAAGDADQVVHGHGLGRGNGKGHRG